ncbi:MAG: biotin--[acetyl-CoA-carboxylase] ligase [Desulfobulbaceae bacterium]|nr:biotin--[acetyl-CoA-carboxylase] ligase [Desulfobulbaceae bacterium]
MEILSFARLPSTNAYALELAAGGAQHKTVVWALEQSGGRGQYRRRFSSPVGGLYFSLILRPDLPSERLPLVTLAAGVGCCLCLEQNCAVAPLLKWPNDLYVNGKKLGGILTEGLPLVGPERPMVVVGVGLNVNSTSSDYPEELRPAVTTLADTTKKTFDLQRLLESLVDAILHQVHTLKENRVKLLAQWDRRDYLKEQSMQWSNGRSVISGIGQGVQSDGRYSMIDASGVLHSILAGTIKPG